MFITVVSHGIRDISIMYVTTVARVTYGFWYVLGLFASSHMQFNLLANKSVEPTLVEMTEAAINVLSKGDNGYYLFVEGGQIDMAHHVNIPHLSLDETVMLSKAVQRAVEMTSREDTLIVITSDHSHTMTLSGYPHRGSNILGHPQTSSKDQMPYSTLSYANGPSDKQYNKTSGTRYNLTDDNPSKSIDKIHILFNCSRYTRKFIYLRKWRRSLWNY